MSYGHLGQNLKRYFSYEFRKLTTQYTVRAILRPAQDDGSGLPLSREAGSLTPANRRHLRNRSPIAWNITCRPTSEMARVRGMSLGQTSTQF